jgi:hypothetical protein
MAGTKRSGTISNKGQKPDFKRLKAKVGKRAIKPANVTNTAFKAASLHVAGQAVDHHRTSVGGKDESGILVSSRGKSIAELMLQLNHPASNVRLSAMKGVGNVVQSTALHPSTLRPHLSILIPACAKSSVDEDGDVRTVGLQVLKDLVQQQEESGLRPFISLLVAYTTSALNSLDSAMRLDGARAVQLTCRSIPNLVSPSLQTKMLPPFSSLIAERANKNQHAEEILQSLVSLLHTQEEKTNTRNRSCSGHHNDPTNGGIEEPDLIYIGQGRAVNAVLLEGTRIPPFPHCPCVRPMARLEDLPALEDLEEWAYANKTFSFDASIISGQQEQQVLSLPITHELLSKLRDTLVETTEQGGDEVVVVSNASTKPLNMRKLGLLAQAIRLLWNQSSPSAARRRRHDIQSPTTTNNKNENWAAKIDRLGYQITSLFLDVFPISLEDAKPNDRSRIEDLNGELCSTIMDIAMAVESSVEHDNGDASNNDNNKSSLSPLNWINALCLYFLDRLEGLATVPTATLDVIAALLLLQRDDGTETMNALAASRVSILERIHVLFFTASDNTNEVARSTAGRRVALSIRNVMGQEEYLMDDKRGHPLALVMHKIVSCLPSYLMAWRSDFLFESHAIIDLLHNVVRRINQMDHPLLVLLRTCLSGLVVAATSKKSKKTSKANHVLVGSIFEGYPPSLQRKVMGLLVMMESPSEEIVTGLATICSRCNLQDAEATSVLPEIADCIVESIHMIRKTLSMQFYLGFVVTSIGIRGGKNKISGTTDHLQVDTKAVVSFDHGIRRVCRVLVQCGSSHKILQMLSPVLSQWLPKICGSGSEATACGSGSEATASPTDFSVQARAAIAVGTMLALDVQKGDKTSSLFGMAPQLKRSMTVAIARMIAFGSTADKDHDEYHRQWMCPIIALCQLEPSVIKSLLQFVEEIVVDGTLSDPFAQTNTLEALIELVRDTRLISSFPRGDAELVNTSRSIAAGLAADGPARQLGSRLAALLELNTEVLSQREEET